MKKIVFLLFLTCIVVSSHSQKIVHSPKTGFSSVENTLKITKVICSDTATIVSFDVSFMSGNWISIPKETYLKADNSDEKLYVKSAEGININKRFVMPASGKTSYSLVFPVLPDAAKSFDYGEGNDAGSWFIFDVQLFPLKNQSTGLQANWYNSLNGVLTYCFLDSVLIHDNSIWKYEIIKQKKNKAEIKLSGKKGTFSIFTKQINDSTCLIGTTEKVLNTYYSKRPVTKPTALQNEAYTLPVFSNDSAIYCGYIPHYSKKLGMSTMSVIVPDLLLSKQSTFLINIEPTGYFEIKLPVLYPHYCFVRSKYFNESIYLEPGKKLFQLFRGKADFMGESARLNDDLNRLKAQEVNYYDKTRKQILNFNQAEFKEYCTKLEKQQSRIIDSVYATGTICIKAKQISSINSRLTFADLKLNYSSMFESAYRQKNKLTNRREPLNITIPRENSAYIDFLTQDMLSNPLNVISNEYEYLLNKISYSDAIYKGITSSLSVSDVENYFKAAGAPLTTSERQMFAELNILENLSKTQEVVDFFKSYGAKIADFNKLYADTLKIFNKLYPKGNNSDLENYFLKNKIKLSEENKKLITALKAYETTNYMKCYFKVRDNNYFDSLNNFRANHIEDYNYLINTQRINKQLSNLKDSLGLESDFVGDILKCQIYGGRLVEEKSLLSDYQLNQIKAQISNSFVVNYLENANAGVRTNLEINKNKTGYFVHQTPKTAADKVFESIIEKFKGRVIYVDFWATWCAPCRSGIERIKPLKDEMDSTKVAFVYITNQTSPLKTWQNMIPDIKGEHFRVSPDEWNYLTSKFNITGIPHYVLVDKNGQVVDPAIKFLSNDEIKKLLNKYISE